ncbi:phosphatidylinositol alpha-1,6-mannosyltransferase [Rhodococcus sp. SORGH_AS 301]|nr:phosphatidylinositol alpha-1,6-mannosyltransferase [Rhodococcus sp. SORGH_AS_0301]
MRRTLLVTNDFPPRRGGIQSYLHTFAQLLPADELVVYAPRWRGDSHVRFDAEQPFEVVRHPTTLMLPTPDVARRAARLVADRQCDTVWFGAAAPLAVLGPHLRRAGAERVVASTHGHEVGWSMLPAARQVLGRIGSTADVVTFVSRYTRGRFAAAFGADAALEHVPPGVDSTVFAPDTSARETLRARYGLGDRPTVLCLSRLVPRKGQDMLIRALPGIRAEIDGAVLVVVGGGPYGDTLRALAQSCGVADHVVFTGSVPAEELGGTPHPRRRVRHAVSHPRCRSGRRGPGHRVPRGVRVRRAGGRGPVGWSAGDRRRERHRHNRRRHLGRRRPARRRGRAVRS